MMSGYCHYHEGAVLTDATFTVRAPRPYRLTGERARARFGNLVRAPRDWPHLEALRAKAESFRLAVVRRERAALIEMHGIAEKPHEQEARLLHALIDDPASPFGWLRTAAAPQSAIFVSLTDYLRTRQGHSPEQAYGTVCYCRGRDCENRWPISSGDTDNARERPYVCTHIVWRNPSQRKGGIHTPLTLAAWLAEPLGPSPEK